MEWKQCDKNEFCQVCENIHLCYFKPKIGIPYWEAWDQSDENCPTIGKWHNKQLAITETENYIRDVHRKRIETGPAVDDPRSIRWSCKL